MLFIPLGHDKEIYRFPYVTIGIMSVCFGVQVYSCFAAPSEESLRAIEQEQTLLSSEVWLIHGQRWLSTRHPDLLNATAAPKSRLMQAAALKAARELLLTDFRAGKLVPKDDPLFKRHLALEERIRANLGLLSHGYRPGAPLYTLVGYAFIHGGWLHLIGNLIFLYLCGCNIEDRWGRGIWPLFYVLGGVASALTWGATHGPTSTTLVGASGAIAAALGAFLVLNARANIQIFYFIWFFTVPVRGTFEMRAYWALPIWAFQQLFGMYFEGYLMTPVAYSAHVGGFTFGVAVALVMKLCGWDAKLSQQTLEKATVYRQHPLFLLALEQAQQGDRAAAVTTLQTLLQQDPDHVDATLELIRLADAPSVAANAAERATQLARKVQDPELPARAYLELAERFPDAPLSPRALFAAAAALERTGQPERARSAYERLIGEHGDDVLAPKVLLNLAQLVAARLNERDRARMLLTTITERFPGTPFADQAQALLAELPPAPSQTI